MVDAADDDTEDDYEHEDANANGNGNEMEADGASEVDRDGLAAVPLPVVKFNHPKSGCYRKRQ